MTGNFWGRGIIGIILKNRLRWNMYTIQGLVFKTYIYNFISCFLRTVLNVTWHKKRNLIDWLLLNVQRAVSSVSYIQDEYMKTSDYTTHHTFPVAVKSCWSTFPVAVKSCWSTFPVAVKSCWSTFQRNLIDWLLLNVQRAVSSVSYIQDEYMKTQKKRGKVDQQLELFWGKRRDKIVILYQKRNSIRNLNNQ
jgi:hypothetical protein